MSFMKIWGREAFVKCLASDKLGTKLDICYFVGYPIETRETYVIRRSIRIHHESGRNYGFLFIQDGDVMLTDKDQPHTYQDAMNSPDSERWLEAKKSAMESMYQNKVLTLVDPLEGVKPIGCKWVFKKKTDMDGKVQTYKVRLVAKGFKQIHGIDYDETFLLVIVIKSIRILLSIVAYFDYEIWKMDFKNYFLYGSLEQDVYMIQPEGFVNPVFAKIVCKLILSIYRLKQASRRMNIHFDETVKEFGFIQNEDEPCVYNKAVKTWLRNSFSVKDLDDKGRLRKFQMRQQLDL
ncbi:hypothetical protein AgCh_002619 [Apium graveolens]